MINILYLHGRKGRIQADLGLQIGAEKEADVVVIVEGVKDQKRRNSHAVYDLVVNLDYLAVYVRKDREFRSKKRGKGEWVLIGVSIAAIYLPPRLDHDRVVRALSGMVGYADTIIGDRNHCGGTKKRRLEEFIQEQALDDVSTTQHTHEWGQYKCRIDRVLTRGGGRPWAIEEGWECLNDHSMIGARVQSGEPQNRTLKQTDWTKVREYVDRREDMKKVGAKEYDCKHTGEAYRELVKLLDHDWMRKVNICARSKRWWKKQWNHLKRKGRKDKKARKQLARLIKQEKPKCWSQWVEGAEDVWKLTRVARNPFNLKERLGPEGETGEPGERRWDTHPGGR